MYGQGGRGRRSARGRAGRGRMGFLRPLLFAASLGFLGSGTWGLYVGDAHVLTLRDFTPLSAQPDTLFAIEFYAGWCGHCQAFAPTWSATAAAGCAAAPQLVVGAVDCAADFLLCRSMGIDGYPTVRVYGRGLTPTGVTLSQCAHGCPSAIQMLDAILWTARTAFDQACAANSMLKRPPLLSDHPPVTPLTGARLTEASADQCAATASTLQQQIQLAKDFEPPAEMRQRPVPMGDVTSAVVYGVQRELVKSDLGAPGSERRAALDHWLATLEALLPGRGNRESMRELRRAAAAQESLSPLTWENVMTSVSEPLLPDGGVPGGIGWGACRGATASARGYPCGLWLLFHTLLAQARTDGEAGAALRAIRGYVTFFFGCTGCTQHFLAMARAQEDPLDAATLTMVDARLWLWRAHNTVNRRLNGSLPQAVLRLGLPKLQWPIQLDCPRCHIPPYAWNASAVASYLHGTYCHPEASVRSCNDPTGGASTTALAAAVAGRLAFGGDLTSYLQLEAGEVAAVSSAFEGALGGNDFVYILLGAGCACLVVRWLTKGSGRRQKTASSWVRVNVTSSPTDHTRHGYSWAHGAVPRHSGDVENEVCCLLKHERGALELQ